jgi:hypothetical protein
MKRALTYLFAILCITLSSCGKEDDTNTSCDDVQCINGGACNNGVCQCPTGYTGASCQIADPCAGVTCQNGGTCNNGSCDCPAGFTGTNCQTPVGTGVCATFACEHGDTMAIGSNCFCQCDPGYTGEHCDQLERTEYIGTYDASTNCSGTPANYVITIVAGTADNRIAINNIDQAGHTTTATVSGGGFDIPTQAFGSGTITGSGSISSGTLQMYFTKNNSGSCSLTGLKQ